MPRRHFTRIGVREVEPLGTSVADAAGYPRPQLRRAQWILLDGPWSFALDPDGDKRVPRAVEFDRTIEVPFSPETEQSAIGDGGLYRACWYRRSFEPPQIDEGQRLLLHFGAVDYYARVWINGTLVVEH